MLHLIGHVGEIPRTFTGSLWDCSALHPQTVQDEFVKTYKKLIERGFYIVSSQEAIFNIVGHMIMNGLISPDDVSYTLYHKDSSVVTKGVYNNDGFLENFPYGFFESDMEFGEDR